MTRSTIHTAMAYYLSLALLTTTTLAGPSWEPNHSKRRQACLDDSPCIQD